MALATVTYNAWDANRAPIPAINEPEVWFRPLATSLVAGLVTDREVKGSLDYATGAGQVQLESAPGLLYLPIMRWLKNPEDPRNRARSEAEWPVFFPDTGGPIQDLDPTWPLPGLVWCSPTAPDDGVRAQFQFNMTSKLLYERVVRW